MPRGAAAAALLLSVGNLGLHLPVSAYFDALSWRIGFPAYERGALAVLVGAGALGAVGLARARQVLATRGGGLRLVALALVTGAVHLALIATNIELVHLPQFALVALFWCAAGLPPAAAFGLALAAGLGDELYQGLHLYPDRGLDLNDVVLNALGAAWGVALWAGRGVIATSARLRRGVGTALLAAAIVSAAATGLPGPPLETSPKGHRYRVIGPAETFAAVALVWALLP